MSTDNSVFTLKRKLTKCTSDMYNAPVHNEADINEPKTFETTSDAISLCPMSWSAELEFHLDQLFADILHPETRAQAIIDLSEQMGRIPRIGLLVYSRPAILTAILLEIVNHYPQGLVEQGLDPTVTKLICAIVGLFQKIILDRTVRHAFFHTDMLLYLLPYMNHNVQTGETEQIRVSLLGLYATAASKLSIELMETLLLQLTPNGQTAEDYQNSSSFNRLLSHTAPTLGLYDHTVAALQSCQSEVGKTTALVLLTQLLTSSKQLNSVAQDAERFFRLIGGLSFIVAILLQRYTTPRESFLSLEMESQDRRRAKKLFQFTMACFYRMATGQPSLSVALRTCLPSELRGMLFADLFQRDPEVMLWLEKLWSVLNI